MKCKKIVMMSAAIVAFMSMSLNVSAARSSVDKYINRLKESGQIDLILDVEAYRAAYSDLEEAFGDDEDAYIKHYLTAGVYEEERRKGVLFDPLAYAEGYDDIMDAFGDDVLAIVSHYVTYGVKENRTAGTAAGYEDIAAAMEESAVQSGGAVSVKSSSVVSESRAEAAGSRTQDKLSGFRIGHTTSIYADDGATLIRVEYYDENNKLVYYSDVIGYDSATNSYTENIYSYDEKEQREVLEQTDIYVNGACSSAK